MNRKKNLPQSAIPNKDFVSAARDEVLDRVEKDYEEFKKTHTFDSQLGYMVLQKVNCSK